MMAIRIYLLSCFSAIILCSLLADNGFALPPDVEAARQRMLRDDALQQQEEARAQDMLQQKMTRAVQKAGFIAISKEPLRYAEAVQFCKKHGGRLPKINNLMTYDFKNPPVRGIVIDGFGYGHRPFSEIGLPEGLQDAYVNGHPICFWTDTKFKNPHYGLQPIFVEFTGYPKKVTFFSDEMRVGGIALCVP